MIKVFCGKRGTGKTKRLLGIANEGLKKAKGDSVYIDVNNKKSIYLQSDIRFINTKELEIKGTEGIYGLICGIIAQNYDVENVYIDNLTNMIDISVPENEKLFEKLEELSRRFNINIFINIDCDDCNLVQSFIKLYYDDEIVEV